MAFWTTKPPKNFYTKFKATLNIIERKSRFLDLKVGTSDYVPCYGE